MTCVATPGSLSPVPLRVTAILAVCRRTPCAYLVKEPTRFPARSVENPAVRAHSPAQSKAHPQPWPARTPGEHHGLHPPPAAAALLLQEKDPVPYRALHAQSAPGDDPSLRSPSPATPAWAKLPSVCASLLPHRGQPSTDVPPPVKPQSPAAQTYFWRHPPLPCDRASPRASEVPAGLRLYPLPSATSPPKPAAYDEKPSSTHNQPHKPPSAGLPCPLHVSLPSLIAFGLRV